MQGIRLIRINYCRAPHLHVACISSHRYYKTKEGAVRSHDSDSTVDRSKAVGFGYISQK